MIGRRLIRAYSVPKVKSGILNASFEDWTDGINPDNWILSAGKPPYNEGTGWEKNTNAHYVSDGVTSLNLYRRGYYLYTYLRMTQQNISLDGLTKYSKLVFDVTRADFTSRFEHLVILADLTSPSLGYIAEGSLTVHYEPHFIEPQVKFIDFYDFDLNIAINDAILNIIVYFNDGDFDKLSEINFTIDKLRFE